MKGLDKLKEKLPDYQGKKLRLFQVIAFSCFIISLVFQLIMDSLPRIFPDIAILQLIAPLTPIIGSILVVIIGLTIVRSFWKIRDKYLSKYGIKAYQKAFRFVAIGIPIVISVVVHSFFPTDLIVRYVEPDVYSSYLGTPITEFLLIFPPFFLYIRVALLFIFLLLGLTVVFKALRIFGIDNMALVYVYYPNESTLQNHEIYSILRHPAYHGLMLIIIGSIFLRFSIYSVIYLLVFLVGMKMHLKFVEEKELIERFGEQYKKYRENVPAFFVKLKDFKKYFSILFNK
jgi:protein-S-isoprenylcysteine O-methyltransferase Ste14